MLISVSINLTDVIHAALLLHLAYADLEFLEFLKHYQRC